MSRRLQVDDDQVTMFDLAPPEMAERWLARQVVCAEDMLHLSHGDRDGARSAITGRCRGCWAGDIRWQTGGGKVTYRHPEHGEGSVTITRLVAIALEARTDEKAEQLRTAYRAYVEEAINGRVPYPRDWAAELEQLAAAHAHFERYRVVSRDLEAARSAWWTP